MSKLEKIKMMLSELLEIETNVEFASATSDKGVIFWEGELAEGVAVFVEDENGERIPAEDGVYQIGNATEKVTIEIADGVIKSYEVEEMPVDEPEQEEPVEDEKPEDEVSTEDEEPAEETQDEEPVVEEEKPVEDDKTATDIEILYGEIESLKTLVNALMERVAELEAKPAAMSAEQEFEQVNAKTKKTGASRYTQYLK